VAPPGRFEPFARQGDSWPPWYIPKLPRATAVYEKIQSRSRHLSPTAPSARPGARRVCPPQRRRVAAAGSRPDAECAGLGDVGAVGGDAGDDVLGGQHRCHLPPTS
jgi:hypothetical protein